MAMIGAQRKVALQASLNELLLLAAALSFISPQSLSAAGGDNPPSKEDNIVLHQELHYRGGTSNQDNLDLAMPGSTDGRRRPAIVVIHGGGWIEGDKSSFSAPNANVPGNIQDFARLGFVAATINYRLSGIAPFPAALNDCRCAIRWLRANAEKYHIDPERIGAYGNSAGGHLATLLALIPEEPLEDKTELYPDQSSRVQAAVTDSGPIDLIYQYQHNELVTVVQKFLGGPPEGSRLELYRRASPSSYVSPSAPPLLFIYGEIDEQVNVKTADRLVTDLAVAGALNITYIRLAGVGHCPHSIQRIPYLRQVVNDFFTRTLRPDK